MSLRPAESRANIRGRRPPPHSDRGNFHVPLNKLPIADFHVVVDEHQNLAAGNSHRFVAGRHDAGRIQRNPLHVGLGPQAVELRLKFGRPRGILIGDDDFQIRIILCEQIAQRVQQRLEAAVGGNDHRYRRPRAVVAHGVVISALWLGGAANLTRIKSSRSICASERPRVQ